MESKTYKIKGMHCASCAGIIEKTLKKTEGVSEAQVNYGTESAKLAFDPTKTDVKKLSEKIAPLGYTLLSNEGQDHAKHIGMGETKNEKQKELAQMKTKVISIIPLALISIFLMAWDLLVQVKMIQEMPVLWSQFFAYALPLMATYALFVVGQPYLMGVYRFVRYGKANMDTLIGIGTSAAYLYSFFVTAFADALKPYIQTQYTYFDVTIVVIAFISLGKYLETRSKMKTGDAIEKLLNLQAKTATVLRDGKEKEIAIDQLMLGDLVVVKPAGRIPVDGLVAEGESYVDESVVTGESMPVQKTVGDTVVGGTMNTSGSFSFRATKIGADTMLAHIIKMVEEAQGSRAPIQALADKISSVFVPIVLVIAFLTLVLWIMIGSGPLGFSQAFSNGLVCFVGVLVIACPCALGLATPTAIIVGVGKGAQEGILVKDAATLEKLHKITTLVVDKTGTLTKGKPELTSVKCLSIQNETELISILASLEKKSEHPIAHAICTYAEEKKINLQPVTNFEALKGLGLKGTINGVTYYAGNEKLLASLPLLARAAAWLAKEGVGGWSRTVEKETSQGKTPIILATDNQVLGVVMVADALKENAVESITHLHKLGIKVIMLTGDHKNTAEYIGTLAGVDEVFAEILPEGKIDKIKELQAEGKHVAMAGDGVNDAPALAQADVGIAMATGTDVAIESAGITLLHGDISKITKAIALSRLTMRGIKQNLFWAFAYNIIGIPLAAGVFFPFFGWLLSPVFAGLAMAFSSVSVVGNSLRINMKGTRHAKEFQYAIPIALLFVIGFLLLQKIGLVNLINADKFSYGTAFLIGIVASLSTCMAVVGGLVLSMSATFAKSGDKIKPQLLFHVGRIVSFFLLGGVIGVLGSTFRLNPITTFILSFAIGIVMLILGINLLDVFGWAKKLQPAMPRFISKHAYGFFELNHRFTPLLVGIATFFLPCGFTQSMQLYTLTTGNFWVGGFTMLAFALGTLPVLSLISFSSFSVEKSPKKGIFFKTAGLIVILFALLNLASSFVAIGLIPPILNF